MTGHMMNADATDVSRRRGGGACTDGSTSSGEGPGPRARTAGGRHRGGSSRPRLDRPIRVLTTAVPADAAPRPGQGRPARRPGRPPRASAAHPRAHGLWMSAALLDLVPGTRRASQVLIAAGLAGAVPTVLTGIADWSALHREQQRVGLVHAAGMAAASTLYSASFVGPLPGPRRRRTPLRLRGPHRAPRRLLSGRAPGVPSGRRRQPRRPDLAPGPARLARPLQHRRPPGRLARSPPPGLHRAVRPARRRRGPRPHRPVQPPGGPPPPGPHRHGPGRRDLRRLPLARQHLPRPGRLGRPRPRHRPPARLRDPGDRERNGPGPPPRLTRRGVGACRPLGPATSASSHVMTAAPRQSMEANPPGGAPQASRPRPRSGSLMSPVWGVPSASP